MTEDKRERIKHAIQTCQDGEGRLMYAIPPGAAGHYADAIMRALMPTHFECDCIPELGPSHCHGCTEEGDGPIAVWSLSRHTEADRQLEQAQRSLDALHSDGDIEYATYLFLHDRIGLALAAIEKDRQS